MNRLKEKIAIEFFMLFDFIILFQFATCAQTVNNQYNENVDLAQNLFLNRNYKEAIPFYQVAFRANKDQAKVIDRYNLATCWALNNKPDSAFIQLQRIVEKGKFASYVLISRDVNLFGLHKDPRWEPLMNLVKANGELYGKY
ncbi:hypothetical protein [Pedobacter sandarakinus]|uniref:hypothetical protein n=1 Tax=Pedobacter sandarakinus TaxID=353156 RepID=UPI002245393D|nr:hypothetical protein [Pedobacter sandarakinus]MCX2576235.1 hypothetical protein [Pedobacter sandarakinus]